MRINRTLLLRNAAILLVAFGLGVALAAHSDGVPGDPFYRAKRAAERPVQIIDRDIVAANRVGELEKLIERQAEPERVLTATADATAALHDRGPDDELTQAFSLLAWPGALAGRGVDVAAFPEGLLITKAEWSTGSGYTAALADGHLVSISAIDGEIVIGTTGDWTAVTTGQGWRLTTDGIEQTYVIERQGDDLRVTSSGERGPVPAAGDLEEASPSDDRSVFGRPPVSTEVGTSVPGRASSGSTPSAQPANRRPETTGVGSGTTALRPPTTSPRPTDGPGTSGTQRPTTTGAGTTTTRNPTTPGAGAGTSTTRASFTTTTTRAPTSTAPTSQPPTTRAPTTQAPTTSPPPIRSWTFYLDSSSSQNTSSSRNLPLRTGAAPSGSLRNFDTNRDGGPGLLIQKDGGGLSVSDSTKSQEWVWNASAPTTLNGDVSFIVWAAAKDFSTGERIGLLASLELCSPGCSRLGTGQWSASVGGGGDDDDDDDDDDDGPRSGDFRQATVGFGSVNVSVPAGATLRLKVVVPDSLATTDIWFAYDSGSHPSRLKIG